MDAGTIATMKTRARGAEELYLELLKQCLTRRDLGDEFHMVEPNYSSLAGRLYAPIRRVLASRNLSIFQRVSAEQREIGELWPTAAETMLGRARLDNIQECVTTVLKERISGDLIETGVWRGGATILMRATLMAYRESGRVVWVADSFEGLPKPDPARFPQDLGDRHWAWAQLAVSLDEVRRNFARYDLLDEQVAFLPGWFKDTLPDAPIERLAVLRIDGDMYESTIDPLRHLYPRLSPGGFVIIDDYSNPKLVGCRQAVDDYRYEHGIADPITEVDWTAVFWRKSGS